MSQPPAVPNHKKLASWTACRIDPVFSLDPRRREYGHWWLEVGESESYGFWPDAPVGGVVQTLRGVSGAVNARNFCPNPRRDRHHGDRGAGIHEFDVWAPDGVDEVDLLVRARAFADGFLARWAWPATPLTGENCHSFQEKLLKALSLRVTPR